MQSVVLAVARKEAAARGIEAAATTMEVAEVAAERA
jgi:hypothetical protein